MMRHNGTYISSHELKEELGISEHARKRVIADAIWKQKAEGGYIINSRPPKVSRKAVYEMLGIGGE